MSTWLMQVGIVVGLILLALYLIALIGYLHRVKQPGYAFLFGLVGFLLFAMSLMSCIAGFDTDSYRFASGIVCWMNLSAFVLGIAVWKYVNPNGIDGTDLVVSIIFALLGFAITAYLFFSLIRR